MSIAVLRDPPTAAPDRRTRVLLVEDNEPVRKAIALALRASGADVTAVPGGAEALVVFDAVHPEVMITDVGMPGMSGLDLVAGLRARGIRVPVLVVSARDGVSDRAAAFDAGADAFLAKPFGLGELLSRVSELARIRFAA